VVVGGPDVYEVAEGGITSSFKVTLSSFPLSVVVVAFSSANGAVTLSPNKAVFDFTNFSTEVSIVITANNDYIDQGWGRNDFIDASVMSADDLTACEVAERSLCNRAGIYNGVDFAPLHVTVIDDDVAGVSISAAALSANFDNYGDSLEAASYNISLRSQPTSTVIISLGGFNEFTSVSQSVIVIEPSSWDVVAIVTVSAGAPSSNRPVCASGNRFCDAIVGRSETIVQTVNTLDSYYANITLPTVSVNVEVVYDLGDPPKVKTGRFANLLNSLVVTFDKSTDRASKSGTFACTALLNMTSSVASSLFGSGSKCIFTSPLKMEIIFGSGATVLPGDLITFKDNTLQSSAASASLFTTNETFSVGLPSVPTIPKALLSASALKVGVCDDLTLDGSATTGSGGRSMIYNFSAHP